MKLLILKDVTWQGTRPLMAGDVFINVVGAGDPIGFLGEAEGRRSQGKLARLLPQAVFTGSSKSIVQDAANQLQRAATRRRS